MQVKTLNSIQIASAFWCVEKNNAHLKSTNTVWLLPHLQFYSSHFSVPGLCFGLYLTGNLTALHESKLIFTFFFFVCLHTKLQTDVWKVKNNAVPSAFTKDLHHFCLCSLSNTSLLFQFWTCRVVLCSKAPVKDTANKSVPRQGWKRNKNIRATTDYLPAAPDLTT